MQPHPFGLAYSLSPVDLPEPLESPAPPGGLRWTSTVIAVAALTLALLNAPAIRGWAYQLSPDATSARAVQAAEAWHDAVGTAGLNRPVETIHGRWQFLKDLRFRDQVSPASPPSRQARAKASSATG
jgi:hypothetical protein